MVLLKDPSGIAEGIKATGTTLGSVIQNIVKQRAQGLTPYQQISTMQREKEQVGKTERAVMNALNQFSDIKKGTVMPKDVPSIYKDVIGRIKQGQNAAEALNQGVRDYQYQKDLLLEMDIDKYSSKKGEGLKDIIVEKFKQNNIKNPSLIEEALKIKRWPAKERRGIALRMQGVEGPLKVKGQAQQEEAKMPPPNESEGKIIRDTKTNKRYKSDGKNWKEIK